ncbi:hypothetical protein [Serratia sp. DD3]|uniref:hypothetical protein n=1 Tax=Serratia sp. DD3 TaxID=1410619 RepID=UPI0003C50C06|nr:hypothetical protein [Serratia sp. DD3]KEY59302.1 hypothetical protein SRDD_15820 [Serratia sp. DD3]
MAWDIPPPYAVHPPAPLAWAGWWRFFSLLTMLCVAIGCGLWFWLKDSRLLLVTFGAVISVALLFIGIAGWRLFNYGVNAEQAKGIADQNDWHLAEWQAWAQSGIDVLDYSVIFPASVPQPAEQRVEVNSDQPLSLGERPSMTYLFEELLAPLRGSLAQLRSPVWVYLPCEDDESTRACFLMVWEKLGLAATGIIGYTDGAVTVPFAERITHWLNEPDGYAKLMIFTQWADNDANRHATDGMVAWLIAPGSAIAPYRCRLHRPMTGAPGTISQDTAQFLTYQPIAMGTTDLWFNELAIGAKDQLIVERCQRLREQEPTANPGSPAQQFIPHWLGQSGPATDWFTLTMMMLMAEYRRTPQGLVLAQGNTLLFATVSAGVSPS